MKKTTSAFIAMLLAGSIALLSACSSDNRSEMSDGGSSSVTGDSSSETSVHEESSEESAESEESSKPEESSEESTEPEESVYIPPLGTPTKLIPIVEFGFGDGDYELGYSKPDEYGFTTGPNGFCVNGNDILVNDNVNRRLLVYRDGKLIDKVDISEYPIEFNCTLTDDYYYIIDELGSVAYRIDRQTKEFKEIDFEAHDCSKDNDYTWSFRFEKVDGKIYIRGQHNGDDDVCYLIDGAKAPTATFPFNSSAVSYTDDKYVLNEGNSKKTLELIEQKNGINTTTAIMAHKDGFASMICQSMRYRDAEKNLSYYHVYYKLSSDGTVIGRYIQFLNDVSDVPKHWATLNSYKFSSAVTDDGDLFVVDGDGEHVTIYKVEFGMDELPFAK